MLTELCLKLKTLLLNPARDMVRLVVFTSIAKQDVKGESNQFQFLYPESGYVPIQTQLENKE